MCLGTIGEIDRVWDEGGVPMASAASDHVCLLYVPDAGVGDLVLVHMGFALEVLDAETAETAMQLRSELSRRD